LSGCIFEERYTGVAGGKGKAAAKEAKAAQLAAASAAAKAKREAAAQRARADGASSSEDDSDAFYALMHACTNALLKRRLEELTDGGDGRARDAPVLKDYATRARQQTDAMLNGTVDPRYWRNERTPFSGDRPSDIEVLRCLEPPPSTVFDFMPPGVPVERQAEWMPRDTYLIAHHLFTQHDPHRGALRAHSMMEIAEVSSGVPGARLSGRPGRPGRPQAPLFGGRCL
jgi:hypothetical protein